MTDDISQPPEMLAGGCMCGAVRYTIAEKPLATGLCHCDRCRPQSGSAFSTVIFVNRSAVTITGETADFEDVGSSGLKVLRRYCLRCGSPLFTVPDVTPDLMMVKAGGIDSNEWFHRSGNCSSGAAGLGWRPSRARRSSKAIRKSEEEPRRTRREKQLALRRSRSWPEADVAAGRLRTQPTTA
jgi:hypothetical protein